MAASVKCKMDPKKCAKFVYLGETDNSDDFNEEREALGVSCKGNGSCIPERITISSCTIWNQIISLNKEKCNS
ncbi:hypothetical protein CEXT_9881, partial [Caerostris extrusa]